VSPLRRLESIEERLQKVGFFLEGKETRRHLRAVLQGWPDVERILARLTAGTVLPRDLAHLAQGLRRIPKLQTQLSAAHTSSTALGHTLPAPLTTFLTQFPAEPALADLLEKAIVDAPPATMKDGGVIRPGYDPELDEVRSWITDGKNRLLELEKREREQTGIPSLKVGFNNVFGYYIEVTSKWKDQVPADWIRKQTIANGERFITPELKELESKILGAEEKILELEERIFRELVDETGAYISQIQHNAQVIARLDCLLSFAKVAVQRNYKRPELNDSFVIDIRDGRHPVIETQLPVGESYIPNDVYLDNESVQIILITGPNMAGKSALLRQTALIVLMAQMGSFVPAGEAHIGLLDKVFTRVGASDKQSRGLSTFLVEMTETANILRNATKRSLVVLDEIGRGTSTYDGVSIAWSVAEYLHQAPHLGCRSLFATRLVHERQRQHPARISRLVSEGHVALDVEQRARRLRFCLRSW
jgi:DNA mismatch repair protein MutS